MRRLLALLLVGLGLVVAAPSAHAMPMLGIADQKPAMFTDPLFTALDIRKARIVIPWDVLRVGWQADELDAWLTAAHDAGVRPLVSFGHSRRPGRARILPTPAQLQREFRRLRHRYPYVTEWATWNEANHCSQATCHKPELVARYYDALRRACPTCTILAAEVLDMPNMVRWIKAFRRTAKVEPKAWGLHNYLDANRLRTIGTRRLLAHTKGQVWFTETGGIVKRRTRRHIHFPESPSHAAKATRWVFRRLATLSGRITRVYLYHWNTSTPTDTWDSALLSPHGKPRPAYEVLERESRAIRAARAARARKRAARKRAARDRAERVRRASARSVRARRAARVAG